MNSTLRPLQSRWCFNAPGSPQRAFIQMCMLLFATFAFTPNIELSAQCTGSLTYTPASKLRVDCVGENTTFTVAFAGTNTGATWEYNSGSGWTAMTVAAYPGFTVTNQASLTRLNLAALQSGWDTHQFRAIIPGCAASDPFTLNVSGSYSISGQVPVAPIVVCSDASAAETFTVYLSNTTIGGSDPNLSFTWQSGPSATGPWTTFVAGTGVTITSTPNGATPTTTASVGPTASFWPAAGSSVWLQLLIDKGACNPIVSAPFELQSKHKAVVNAGPDATICSVGTTLAGSVLVNGSTPSSGYTWSANTGGNGQFDPSTSDLNAIFTPSTPSGTRTLTLTYDDGAAGCANVTDQVVYTIQGTASATATVSASPVCAGTVVSLTGTPGGSATTGSWTHNGTGTLSDPSAYAPATPTYTPGPGETGTVTFTFTTDDPSGVCPAATATVSLEIVPATTVYAGADQTVCIPTPVMLSGTTTGTATGGVWTSSTPISGTFAVNSDGTVTYMPAPGETSATFTFTSTGSTTCPDASDDVTITFQELAVTTYVPTTSGMPGTKIVCEGGSTTFRVNYSGTVTPTVVWTINGIEALPAAVNTNATRSILTVNPATLGLNGASIVATITAGVCTPIVTAPFTLNVNAPAVVDAGMDQVVCLGSTANLAATVSGGTSTGSWTATPGLIASGNSATFTPGGVGPTTLTFTADAVQGCPPASDEIVVTAQAAHMANAGPDQSLCVTGPPATLAASFGGGALSGSWLPSTSGTFLDVNNPTTTFTPNPGVTGPVTLTFQTNPLVPAGVCPTVQDQMTITYYDAPIVALSLASPYKICDDAPFNITTTLTNSTSAIWSGGAGTFNDVNVNILAPVNGVNTYDPTPADIANGVTLMVTTNDPLNVCPATSATLMVQQLDNSDLTWTTSGDQLNVCDNAMVTFSATASPNSTWGTPTYSWEYSSDNGSSWMSTSPSSSSSSIMVTGSTTWAPNPGGSILIRRKLVLADGCDFFSPSMTWSISAAGPVAINAGLDQTVCYAPGLSFTLGGVNLNPNPAPFITATSATWSILTPGVTGTFNDPIVNVGSAPRTFTPTSLPANGQIMLLLTTNDAPGQACNVAKDTVLIIVERPVVLGTSTTTMTVCSGAVQTNSMNLFTQMYTQNQAPTSIVWTRVYGTAPVPMSNNATLSAAMRFGTSGTTTWTAAMDSTVYRVTFNYVDCPSTTQDFTLRVNHVTPGVMMSSSGTSEICTNASSVTFTGSGASESGPAAAATVTWQYIKQSTNTGGTAPTSGYTAFTGGVGYTIVGNVLTLTNTSTAWPALGGQTWVRRVFDKGGCMYSSAAARVRVANEQAPTSNAGPDQTVCYTAATPLQLAGVIGGGATSGAWMSSAGGTFSDPNFLNSTFTPPAAGTYTLTLTSNNPPGAVCNAVTDQMTIIAESPRTVDAYTPSAKTQTVCEGDDPTMTITYTAAASATVVWETDNGTGTWTTISSGISGTNPSSTLTLTDVATAQDGHKYRASITGNGCPAITSDEFTLNVNGAVTFTTQPSDLTICQNITTASFTGMATGAGAGVINYRWQVFNGTSWANVMNANGGNNTTANLNSGLGATYWPAAGSTYTVRLRANKPGCPVQSSDVADFTVDGTPAPFADAGLDQAICAPTNTATMAGDLGGSATSATWTTAGDGAFANSAALNTVYTAGPNDIAAGSVVLTLTTNNPPGALCDAHVDQMTLTIVPASEVSAGPDQSFCSVPGPLPTTVELAATANRAGMWTGGTGTFDDATSVDAVYTLGAGDVAGTSVTLTYTTVAELGCPGTSDVMVIYLNELTLGTYNPTSKSRTICAGSNTSFGVNYTSTPGSAVVTKTWEKFDGTSWSPLTIAAPYSVISSTTNSTLTVSAATTDLNGAMYRVRISNGGCDVVSEPFTLNVNGDLVASAPVAVDVCNAPTATAMFSSTVTSTGITPTYLWHYRINGGTATAIPNNTASTGRTTTSLTLLPASVVWGAAQNPNDVVEVALRSTQAPCPASFSGWARLRVGTGVTISSYAPASQTVTTCDGSNATFTVNFSTTFQAVYTWKENGVPITLGGTNPVFSVISNDVSSQLTLTNVPASANGKTYTLTILDRGCEVTSDAFTLVVNGPIVFGTQPANLNVCQSATVANFSGSATAGTATPTYQWQYKNNSGNWVNVPNTVAGYNTSAVFITPAATAIWPLIVAPATSASRQIRLMATVPGCSAVPSAEATLLVETCGVAVDLSPTFATQQSQYTVGTSIDQVVIINNIGTSATVGDIKFRVTKIPGYTYVFNPAQGTASTIFGTQILSNTQWVMTESASSMTFTRLGTNPGLNAASNLKVAIGVMPNAAGANGSISVNILPGFGGGESNTANNAASYMISTNN